LPASWPAGNHRTAHVSRHPQARSASRHKAVRSAGGPQCKGCSAHNRS
jgi:hypothetical protein